jgi:hypothetical protein
MLLVRWGLGKWCYSSCIAYGPLWNLEVDKFGFVISWYRYLRRRDISKELYLELKYVLVFLVLVYSKGSYCHYWVYTASAPCMSQLVSRTHRQKAGFYQYLQYFYSTRVSVNQYIVTSCLMYVFWSPSTACDANQVFSQTFIITGTI